CQQGNTLPHTF
nr:immunoglobulin light chain junction region [Mus musculus]NSL99301.1 immunoglobulin light chain junction region [Mus musculus]NSM01025.1 immunoglobulin light chain junction region [Mus musculus]